MNIWCYICNKHYYIYYCGYVHNWKSVNEAVALTADAIYGSRTVPSRLGMNKTEAELQRRIFKLIHQGMIKKRNL